MNSVVAKSKCLCGSELEAIAQAPKRFRPGKSKIECKKCESTYLLVSEKKRSEAGRAIVKLKFKILEVSQKLETLLQAKARSPITTGPKEDGKDGQRGAAQAP